MGGIIEVDPSDAAPIWRQIEDGMRRLAASGTLPAGSPVPSVRDLAQELRVNPATVTKAYRRLTETGVLTVRRGEGTYIAERSVREIAADRGEMLADGARRFTALARTVNASREEAVETVEAVWNETSDSGTGGSS